MSFGELLVLVLVALLIFGPKELPKILRKVGLYAGKARRFAADMRAQSGIDDALRAEGLADDIAEIRKLARGEIDGVVAASRAVARFEDEPAPQHASIEGDVAGSPYTPAALPEAPLTIERHRELPREGADSYGALPDTAVVYEGSLPASALATDRLYVLGEDGPPLGPPAPVAASPEPPRESEGARPAERPEGDA